jgi:hypothetical protein
MIKVNSLDFLFPRPSCRQEYHHSLLASEFGAPALRPVKLIEVDGRPCVVLPRLDGLNLVQVLQRSLWRMDSMARLLGRLHAAQMNEENLAGYPMLDRLVLRVLSDIL